ncbi:MAG: tetratricopeptide repeat protein [Prochloraceae cyanobacterium]
MTNSISHQSRRSLFLKNNNSLSNWKSLSLKAVLFFLTASAVFTPGLLVRAEIIIGIIENYNSQRKQATINLGKKDGVGKYDRGKIELTSLDNPNARFIGANIEVVSVKENSAVVKVREAPGVQVPLKAGARVTLDTGSGLARREEEAKLLATQQAEEARRQRQLEQARAQQARRQREIEQARAQQARRQREIEQARAQQARRQREIEQARAQQARRQREIEQSRRQRQPEPANTPTQQKPEDISLAEARDLWGSKSPGDLQGSPVSDLPSDYLKAYIAARRQPSPETYYKFAQVLIDYELPDKALTWLKETQSRFPLTKAVNNFYRAVALIASGDIQKGQNLLETSGMPDNRFTDELRSYLYTQKGLWDKVFSLSKTRKSAITYNNYLIGTYCTQPPALNRDTRLSLNNCPFGNALSVQPQSYQDITTLRTISQRAMVMYPDNPYIINTLGFLALQAEDYNRAYSYYQQLAQLLDKYDSTPPRLQSLKANAITYVNNYNQNYEFLVQRSQNLQLLRSRQNTLSSFIVFDGVGDVFTRVHRGTSTYSIIGGILGTLVRARQSTIQARRLAEERNSILDQMRLTFTRDINLVPARPDLEAKSLLKLASSKVDKQLLRYDNFWNCQCPTSNSSGSASQSSRVNRDSRCSRTCRKSD